MVQGKRTVTDNKIVQWMHESPDPAFTTSEIAGQFDMTTEGIRNRLKELEKQGRIEVKTPGNRTSIWYVESGQSFPVRST
jgi:predicted transcriptional regulator